VSEKVAPEYSLDQILAHHHIQADSVLTQSPHGTSNYTTKDEGVGHGSGVGDLRSFPEQKAVGMHVIRQR
jgi:hypothetical protein